MKRNERAILITLFIAIILVGLLALSILQYQANTAAVSSGYAAATQRQLDRNAERALTPDG